MIGSLVVRFATSGAWRAATTSVARVCLDQIRPLTALPKVPAHMAGSQVSSVFRRSECAPNLKPSSSGVQYCMSQQQTAFPRASGFSLQSQPAGSSVNSMTCYPTRCLLLPCLPVMSLTLQPSTKLNLAPSTTAIPLGSAIWSTHKQQASARVQAHHWMHNAGDTQKAGACQELLSGAGDSQELLSEEIQRQLLRPQRPALQLPQLQPRPHRRSASTASLQLLPKWRQQSAYLSHVCNLHTAAGATSTRAGEHTQPQAPDSLSKTNAETETLKQQPPQHSQAMLTSAEKSNGSKVEGQAAAELPQGSKIVLYKGRYMQAFRMLVRFKVLQLVGIAALAVPINTFLVGGGVSSVQMVMASSLIVGCGVASTALWWFSQRYVGEMSLLVPNKLCFSVLDFWGNRQDNVVSMDQLIPPMQRLSQKEKAELIHQTLFPLDVSADRQYLMSLRHGVLVDKPGLVEVLTEGMYSIPQQPNQA